MFACMWWWEMLLIIKCFYASKTEVLFYSVHAVLDLVGSTITSSLLWEMKVNFSLFYFTSDAGRLFSHSVLQNRMINISLDTSGRQFLLQHNATVESRNTGGARGTGGWPGPRSARTCLDGCASERTHINQAITSSPGRLIGWRRRWGRGNAKNRRDGPFWLNEPMRHQVEDPPLPRSWLGEKGT